MSRIICCLALLGPVTLGPMLVGDATPARAQTKPATSGELSFNEPEMRRHHSGFYRPRRPHRATSLRGLRR